MTGKLGKILHVAFVGALVAQLGLVGCNTIEGAGEDIEKAGDKIEDEASD